MTEQSKNLQLTALGACGGGAPRQRAMLRCARPGATALPGLALPFSGLALPFPGWHCPPAPVGTSWPAVCPAGGSAAAPLCPMSHPLSTCAAAAVPAPVQPLPGAGAGTGTGTRRRCRAAAHRVPAAVPCPVPGSGRLAPAAPRAASTLISVLSEISWCGFHVRWDTYEISGFCVFF